MRVTYCDKCTGECTNGVCIVYMRIEHRTSQGEWVGEDETKPVDLCHPCGEAARKVLGLEVQQVPDEVRFLNGDIPEEIESPRERRRIERLLHNQPDLPR